MAQAEAEKWHFARDWGRVNGLYLLPASGILPVWAFFQPSSGAFSFSEIWISLLFYTNLFCLMLIGGRRWLFRKKGKTLAFTVPLSFKAGNLFYLLPFSVLTSLVLVATQGEQLLKIPQNPGILVSSPFLFLCFFFGFPLLWGFAVFFSWMACWIWRIGRHFRWKFEQEKKRNQQKRDFEPPVLASWVAVNLFYLLPASLALPFLIFSYSEDPDAFFVLLMGWFLLLLLGNLVGGLCAYLRQFFLRKQGLEGFCKIVLSAVQANVLYILPLVLAGSLEATLTGPGRKLIKMDLDTLFWESPWYLCFFLFDMLGFWLLASFFSWCARALATVFWQPDPRPSALKGKRKKKQQEMPDFLIHLPKSLTGNLLEEIEEEPSQTLLEEVQLKQANRPAAGPLFLYHYLWPERLKASFSIFLKEVFFYVFPLGLAWGIGTVFLLGVGSWHDLIELALWAAGMGFLLGLMVKIYFFLWRTFESGLKFLLTGKTTLKAKGVFRSFLNNVVCYLLPIPCLIGFLATIEGVFSERAIAVRSALFGAGAVILLDILASLLLQLAFVIIRALFLFFFGSKIAHLAERQRERKAEKQALKQTHSKWHVQKFHSVKKSKSALPPVIKKPVLKKQGRKRRKITKILTYDGRIIDLKSLQKTRRKRR
ncbi:hypothetical protein FAI40_03460 [Acetobacteraceae bacterium]|nr:hypothetical protein FAI40_03460 [Acetobacteraceae bacterium]